MSKITLFYINQPGIRIGMYLTDAWTLKNKTVYFNAQFVDHSVVNGMNDIFRGFRLIVLWFGLFIMWQNKDCTRKQVIASLASGLLNKFKNFIS